MYYILFFIFNSIKPIIINSKNDELKENIEVTEEVAEEGALKLAEELTVNLAEKLPVPNVANPKIGSGIYRACLLIDVKENQKIGVDVKMRINDERPGETIRFDIDDSNSKLAFTVNLDGKYKYNFDESKNESAGSIFTQLASNISKVLNEEVMKKAAKDAVNEKVEKNVENAEKKIDDDQTQKSNPTKDCENLCSEKGSVFKENEVKK